MQEVMLPAKATILCIDDHWNGLSGRKMLLEENGYKVLEATGGVEGLELFLSHPVDAVVLDYQMSDMNGDVVAAAMKRFRSQVPIMLLSSQELLPKNKLRSVDCFLSKSQPSKTLLATLQKLLEGRSKPFFSRWLDSWRQRNLVRSV
ncbi:MAG: response regulator [Acidobacteria bacterium]|nr:MAG: response regulator [Verrucomicrobiota bacterium]PYV98045.1 MAG: response regulator [Acidobacteriota bacterium]